MLRIGDPASDTIASRPGSERLLRCRADCHQNTHPGARLDAFGASSFPMPQSVPEPPTPIILLAATLTAAAAAGAWVRQRHSTQRQRQCDAYTRMVEVLRHGRRGVQADLFCRLS